MSGKVLPETISQLQRIKGMVCLKKNDVAPGAAIRRMTLKEAKKKTGKVSFCMFLHFLSISSEQCQLQH
ncbi:hypothetical protein SRHO_G00233070 [Serrasalmus rhombeus]